jgi:hypothetical protein
LCLTTSAKRTITGQFRKSFGQNQTLVLGRLPVCADPQVNADTPFQIAARQINVG